MLNFEKFESTPLNSDPFPYMVVEHAINFDQLSDVIDDFPKVEHPGSLPYESVESGSAFQRLVAELNGDEFRRAVECKFQIDLTDKPTMTTVRGVMRKRDGRIHTDSKSKAITVLLYFNDEWQSTDGYLRILRNGTDLDDYVVEVPPAAGTMVVFQVTDNCWHGHKPLVGTRRSLQMNYMVDGTNKGKHELMHKLSAKVKTIFVS